LQTALAEIQKLETKVSTLQEKLSVCYAKEYDYEDEINGYKKTISKLTESVKTLDPLKKRVESLTEELNSKTKVLVDSDKTVKGQEQKLKSLKKEASLLTENLSDSRKLVENLQSQLEKSKKTASFASSQYEKEIKDLNE